MLKNITCFITYNKNLNFTNNKDNKLGRSVYYTRLKFWSENEVSLRTTIQQDSLTIGFMILSILLSVIGVFLQLSRPPTENSENSHRNQKMRSRDRKIWMPRSRLSRSSRLLLAKVAKCVGNRSHHPSQ